MSSKYENPYKDMSVLLRFENGNTRDLVREHALKRQRQMAEIDMIFDSQRAYYLIERIAEIEDSEGFESILKALRPEL